MMKQIPECVFAYAAKFNPPLVPPSAFALMTNQSGAFRSCCQNAAADRGTRIGRKP